MKTLPPCDHDECPPNRCTKTAMAVSSAVSEFTAGQRVVAHFPTIGTVSGVSGDGKSLLIKFDGKDYNSLVGSHQVKLV